MQLRSNCTSLHREVPPDASLGHSNEAQGCSVVAERWERYEAIKGNAIVRSTHCEYSGRHAKRGTAASGADGRHVGHNGPQRLCAQWY